MTEKKDPSKSPRYTNGPVVKSGPTGGLNRSRNDDGAWRKKRSDAGKPRDEKKKSGCFISTAACQFKGLPDNCFELQTLRKFRDEHLLSTKEGSDMVNNYYAIAPAIAEKLIGNDDELEKVWNVISTCVTAIQEGKFVHAIEEYRLMVISLEGKNCI